VSVAIEPTGELLGVVGLDYFQLKVEQQYFNTVILTSMLSPQAFATTM
jgi:hypothetical protein